MSRSKYWVFTLNNPQDHEVAFLSALHQPMTFLVWAKEVGDEGTPHLQGYVEFSIPKTLRAAKSVLQNDRVHLERRMGTAQQARDYCLKDVPESFRAMSGVHYSHVLLGEISIDRSGARSDLDLVRDAIRGGASIGDLYENHFSAMIRYGPNLLRYRAMFARVRPEARFELDQFQWEINLSTSHIFWGEAGIGKTQYALAKLPDALVVSHIDDLKDFDPSIHHGIIFDDMDFCHLPVTSQIHLLDWDMPRSIHVRYGVATIPAQTVKVFTTNVNGGRIFDLTHGGVRRRVNVHELIRFF